MIESKICGRIKKLNNTFKLFQEVLETVFLFEKSKNMYDFIIVGSGLAGVSFAEELRKRNKTFYVITDNSQKSSMIAGGIFNPMILKRFTLAWKAHQQITLMDSFYSQLSDFLGHKIIEFMPILRKFASVEEQNNWFLAAEKPEISTFLATDIIAQYNLAVPAPFGFGKVRQTGRLQIREMIDFLQEIWRNQGILLEETFHYQLLKIEDEEVSYQGIKAQNIVFCEGFGVVKNPFFGNVPMKPCKGELLTFKAENLKINEIVKSDGFIFPIGDDFYKIGATYQWEDLTENPTEKAKEELIQKLEKLINCSYEIINQEAAVRPTVADRRPLIGKHPKYNNLYILNGLGTRGVMIAPYVAKLLADSIYKGVAIDKEVDVNRYKFA